MDIVYNRHQNRNIRRYIGNLKSTSNPPLSIIKEKETTR